MICTKIQPDCIIEVDIKDERNFVTFKLGAGFRRDVGLTTTSAMKTERPVGDLCIVTAASVANPNLRANIFM